MPNVIAWVPGVVASPAAITLPGGSPQIDRVISATITRIRAGLGIPDHAAAGIVAGLADHAAAGIVAGLASHAVHAHDLVVSGGAGAAGTNTVQASAAAGPLTKQEAGSATIVGAGATGVQNNAAVQAHAAGVALAHAAGAALAHGALTGTDPVVAAVPTRLSATTFSLNVNTTLGDILSLTYEVIGSRVAVA